MTSFASSEAVQRLKTKISILQGQVRKLGHARRNDNYRLDDMEADMARVKSRLADITSRPLISGEAKVP